MLIDCGGDLFCGDFTACDCLDFDHVIHLWRNRDVIARATCQSVLCGDHKGLSIHWREEDPINRMSASLDEVIAFSQRPGRLLVHCRGGHCRSANLAIIAASARGLDPFAVIDRMNRERYRLAGGLPAWKWGDLNEIIRRGDSSLL